MSLHCIAAKPLKALILGSIFPRAESNAFRMSSLRSIPVQNQVPVTQLYRKLEIVGKGAYGAVYRGVHIPTGDVVALKIINLDTPDDDVEDIQREVALLSQLRGPGTNNITKYYGCYLDGPHVWIVMDYASGGSVRTLMKATRGNVIDERHSVVIMRELLSALVYIHKSGVIHRDIKAANVLVTDQGRVMLCDFGVSALLSTAHAKRTTFVGTPYWMAPEVITSGSMYDSKADIWSLGITLYEMTTGAPPHSNQVEVKVLSLIPSTKPPRLAEHEGSKDMREFVAMCLKEVPGERASAEELTKVKWIKSAAKTPVSILKELVVQYEAWGRAGGVRKSLFEANEEEDEDSLKSNNRESTWEFDTLRGGSFADFRASGEGSTENESTLNDAPTATAISPPQRVPPRSLRMLFEGTDNPSGGSDPFGLMARPRTTTPASASTQPTSTSTAPSTVSTTDGDRTVKQSASSMSMTSPSAKYSVPPLPQLQTAFAYVEPSSPQPSDLGSTSTSTSHSTPSSSRSRSSSSPTSSSRGSDPTTARQATFAFPPLPPVLATSGTESSISLASSSSSSSSSSSQNGLRPINTTLLSSSDEDSIGARPPRSARTPTYREVRQSRGLPDISIPPNLNKKSKTPSASPTSSSPPARSIPPSFPAVSSSTVRNDSIASGSSTSTIRRVRKVATASPVNFQFPASTRPRVESQPEHPTSSPTSSPPRQMQLAYSLDEFEKDIGSGKTSPTLFRTTSPTSTTTIMTSSSPTSHIATHSLDDSVISSPGTIRHRPGLAMPLPPFSRAHSATPAGGRRYTTATHSEAGAALSRGPSLNRQGSVAVMETVPMPTASMTDRAAIPGTGIGLMTSSSSSLQPPLSLLRGRNRSESASAAGYRSEGDVGGNGGLKMPALKDVLKLAPLPNNLVSGPDFLPPSPSVHTPLNRPQVRPHQPPIPLQIVTATASSSTTSLDQQLSGASSLLEATSAASETVKAPPLTTPLQPPLIKPLELLKSTLSPAEAQAELARTVDDLAKWLSVVEAGLTSLLEKSLFEGGHSVVIQENREEEDAVDGGVFANGSGIASGAGDSGVVSLDTH